MKVVFSEKANLQFNSWLVDDKKIYVKIIDLIESIVNTPFKGIGKPEPLKGNLSGYGSRRINIVHRLVYKIEKRVIYIVQCKYHY